MSRPQSTAVARTNPMDSFKQEIEVRSATFHNALPAHVPVEKFKANLIAATAMTPKLLECQRASLFKAAMTAAQLGLMVDPVLGHAYLVPYGSVVQCIPGYKGLIHLARQSGEIASLYAHEVYENDEFDIELGTNKRLFHKPNFKGDRGKMIGVYAAWSYTKAIEQDGKLATDFEFMTIADIEAIRKRSKAGESGPWKTDFVQMARKTVIRRAAKYLPLSVQRAAALDQAYDEGKPARVEGGEIIIDADDITDAGPQEPLLASRQIDSLEAKMTGQPTPAVSVVTVPQTDGLPDWKAWADAAVAAIQALPAGSIDRWAEVHKAVLGNCEFNAADEAERVIAALKKGRG